MKDVLIGIAFLFLTYPEVSAQKYVYDNNQYDSVLKTGEYFETIDTIYTDSLMYSYRISYNFTSFKEGYEVSIVSPRKIPIQLLSFLSEYFKDTSAGRNDSMAKKLFNYLNGQGIYFRLGSNLFLNSYFNRYRLPCATTTRGLNHSSEQITSDNEDLYRVHKVQCDRYLLVRWKESALHVGMHRIRFPVDMMGQLILVEFPIGIEENYCNRF